MIFGWSVVSGQWSVSEQATCRTDSRSPEKSIATAATASLIPITDD